MSCCAAATGCDEDVRLSILPTLLGGPAFVKLKKLLVKNGKDSYGKGRLTGRFRNKEVSIEAKRRFKNRILRMGEDKDFFYDPVLLDSRAWP